MSTPKKPTSTSHTHAHAAHAVTSEVEAAPAPAPVALAPAAVTPPVAALATTAPALAAKVPVEIAAPIAGGLQLPPLSANIPIPPTGFVPTSGTDYRGIVPKKAELAVLPQVLVELGLFADWTGVFGKTAPPLAAFQQTLNAALQWSLMRNATDSWDLFSRTMEGLAWTDARAMMDAFQGTFAAAVTADATIKTQNPSLASLLNAATVIAQRGAATRKANAKAVANGEQPVKGKAAARVKRAKKIVAGAAGAEAPVEAPVAAPPVVAATPAAAPGGTNGVAH